MGTYRERARELLTTGFDLDVVAYEDRDLSDEGVRYFMIDPSWHPWLDNRYPPFGEAGKPFEQRQGHHGVLTGHFSGDGTDWTEPWVRQLIDRFRSNLGEE